MREYLFKPCNRSEYTTCKNYNIKCLNCSRAIGAFNGLLEIFEDYKSVHRNDYYVSNEGINNNTNETDSQINNNRKEV